MKNFVKLSITILGLCGSYQAIASPEYCFNNSSTPSLQQKGIDGHIIDFSNFTNIAKASDVYHMVLTNCQNISNNGIELNNNEILIVIGSKQGLWFSANMKPYLLDSLLTMQDMVKQGNPAGALQLAASRIPLNLGNNIHSQVKTVVTTSSHIEHRNSGLGFFDWVGILLLTGAVAWAASVLINRRKNKKAFSLTRNPPSSSNYQYPSRTQTISNYNNYPAYFIQGGQSYNGCWFNGYWGYHGPFGFMPWGYYDPYGIFMAGAAYEMEGMILGEMLAADMIMSSDYGYGGYLGDNSVEETTTTATTYEEDRDDYSQQHDDDSFDTDAGGDLDSSSGDFGGGFDDN